MFVRNLRIHVATLVVGMLALLSSMAAALEVPATAGSTPSARQAAPAADPDDDIPEFSASPELFNPPPSTPLHSAPASATPARPVVSPAAPADGKERFYVQVAALSQSTNATALLARLGKTDIRPLRLLQIDNNGVMIYKIRIGPLASAAEAEQIRRKLAAAGLGRGFVIADSERDFVASPGAPSR